MCFLKVIALDLTEGAFTKFRTNQLARLPIRTIDFTDEAEKAAHNKIIQFVEQMLAAKRELPRAVTDSEQNFYRDKCSRLDREIDRLVYELYDLTAAEIAIVERG